MQSKICYRTILLSVLYSLFQAIFLFIVAYIMSQLTSLAISDGGNDGFVFFAVTLLSLVIFNHILSFIFNVTLEKRIEDKKQVFREYIYTQVMHQKIPIIEKIGVAGTTLFLDRHMNVILSFFMQTVPIIIASLVISLTYLIIFLYLDFIIALILLGLSLLKIIPPLIVKKYIQRDYEAINQEGLKWLKFVIEALNGLLIIKAFTLKNWYKQKLSSINSNQITAYANKFIHVGQEQALTATSETITTYGIYVLLGVFLLIDYINIEVAVIIIVLSGKFFTASSAMYAALPNLFEYKIAKTKLNELIINDDTYSIKQSFQPKSDEEVFNISHLYFTYASETQDIFNDFSLIVKKGQKLAIVGENGTGKSTLIKLLLKQELEYKGQINYYGYDLHSINETTLLENIAYLPQHSTSLGFTVGEILACFPDLQENMRLYAHKFDFNIDALKDNQINSLSGGEYKKLSLIICFSQKVMCYLLDEPTNDLDESSKTALIEHIKNCKQTVILITHDADLINACDNVVTLT